MPRLLIVNRAQAPYYKALYSALANELGKDWEILLQTLDKHWKGFDGDRFQRGLVLPEGVAVQEYRTKRISGLGELPQRAMWRDARCFRPDVILVHETAVFNLAAFWLAIASGSRLMLSTEIGLANCRDFSWRVRMARSLIRPLVAGVVAHAPAAMKSDLKVAADRVAKAYHASDSRQVIPAGKRDLESVIRMVFLGQLIPRKGLDLWLSAIRAAVDGGMTVHFDIIGGGEIEKLRNLVAELDLGDFVVVHGFLEGAEITKIMQRAEVFVLPSRYDTYGAVTQEAACYGLALLISRHAGSSVLVEEGVNGYVIDPEDRQGCVEVIRRMVDPDVRRSMMEAGRETGVAFGAERNAPPVAALIRQLCGGS